jgi:hypothetical protein
MFASRWLLLSLPIFLAPRAWAQSESAPTVYTVSEINGMFGKPMPLTVFRDGTTAIVDMGPSGHVSRSFYDLATGRTYSWDTSDSAPQCGSGRFSGDWGDPFDGSKQLVAELSKAHLKDVGTEALHGLQTKILEADNTGQGGGRARVWIDTHYGLVVKWMLLLADGSTQTMMELNSLTLAKPPIGTFKLPPACAKLAAQPPEPTIEEKMVADTGGVADKFVNACTAPDSTESCAVLLSVVHARTMAPIAGGFQVAVDQAVDFDHPAHYVSGVAADGRMTFSGGGLRELTSGLRKGVLRLDHAPAHFYAEVAFPGGGDAFALIHRQCFGNPSRLYFVVKDPGSAASSNWWVWAK